MMDVSAKFKKEQVLVVLAVVGVVGAFIALQAISTPTSRRHGRVARSTSKSKSQPTASAPVKSASPSNRQSSKPRRKKKKDSLAMEPTLLAVKEEVAAAADLPPAVPLTVEVLEAHKRSTSKKPTDKDVRERLGRSPNGTPIITIPEVPGVKSNNVVANNRLIRCSVAATEGSAPPPLPPAPPHADVSRHSHHTHHHQQPQQQQQPHHHPRRASMTPSANNRSAGEEKTPGTRGAQSPSKHTARQSSQHNHHHHHHHRHGHSRDSEASPSPVKPTDTHRRSSKHGPSKTDKQQKTKSKKKKKSRKVSEIGELHRTPDKAANGNDSNIPSSVKNPQQLDGCPPVLRDEACHNDDTQLSSLEAVLLAGSPLSPINRAPPKPPTPPQAKSREGEIGKPKTVTDDAGERLHEPDSAVSAAPAPSYLLREANQTLQRLSEAVSDAPSDKKAWMRLYLFCKQIPSSCIKAVLQVSPVPIPQEAAAPDDNTSDEDDAAHTLRLLQNATTLMMRPNTTTRPPLSLSSDVRNVRFEWRNGNIVRCRGDEVLTRLGVARLDEACAAAEGAENGRNTDVQASHKDPTADGDGDMDSGDAESTTSSLHYDDLVVAGSANSLAADNVTDRSPDATQCSDADRLAALIYCFRQVTRESAATETAVIRQQSLSPACDAATDGKNTGAVAASGANKLEHANNNEGSTPCASVDGERGANTERLSVRAVGLLKGLCDLQNSPLLQALEKSDDYALFAFDLRELISGAEKLLADHAQGRPGALLSLQQLRGGTLTSRTPTKPSAIRRVSANNSTVTSLTSTPHRTPNITLDGGGTGAGGGAAAAARLQTPPIAPLRRGTVEA